MVSDLLSLTASWDSVWCLLTPNRYGWPDKHLDYMIVRAADHGAKGFSVMIRLFKWARSNVERPNCMFISLSDREKCCRLTLNA